VQLSRLSRVFVVRAIEVRIALNLVLRQKWLKPSDLTKMAQAKRHCHQHLRSEAAPPLPSLPSEEGIFTKVLRAFP